MASASTLILFVRLILSLAVVIGLMWVAANVLRKRGFARRREPALGAGPRSRACSRASRSDATRRSQSCASANARWSSASPTTKSRSSTTLEIDEIDLDEGTTWTVPSGANSPATAWKTMLDQMRNRTVRR